MLSVYGADFSGAMNPKLYYAHGVLDGHHLTVKSTVACDDRLDLYHAIISSDDAVWGIDFPFSIPSAAMRKLGYDNHAELLRSVARMTRKEFADFIADEMDDYPRKCIERDLLYCRHTDVALQAHSAFKTVNPNLRVMIYAGLKMLFYLSEVGVNVYPFSNSQREFDPAYPCVYEIYPSYAWRQVGMKRSTDIDAFIERFNDLKLITVSCDVDSGTVQNQDLADSIVACLMMATAYVTQEMNQGWDYRLPIFTDDEWEWRHIEGLIVRF